MRYNYLVYPEALKKLEESGLDRRIKKFNEEEGLFLGYISDEDIVESIREIKEHYSTFPKDRLNGFMEGLNKVFQNREKSFWEIRKFDMIDKVKVESEDILLMGGWYASLILGPEEIWDHRKFGFDSIADLVGVVGSQFVNSDSSIFKKVRPWVSKHHDGRVFSNDITGSEHFDLRIFQEDITPYECADPLGNQVSFRPYGSSFEHTVSGADSTEIAFLASLIKYVTQENIKSDIIEDPKSFLAEVGKLKQSGEGCAEHHGNIKSDLSTRTAFMNFGKIPLISSKETTHDYITMHVSGYYDIYIGDNKEFLITQTPTNDERKIIARFMPSEADNLIEGLFLQAASGTGRTSVKNLYDAFQYRFSDEYDEKENKFREAMKK